MACSCAHMLLLATLAACAPIASQALPQLAVAAAGASAACPTVHPLSTLNISEWIRSSWFVYEQQLNGYQDASLLYCVIATYVDDPAKTVPFFKGKVLTVHNYENKAVVNGKPDSTDKIPGGLCAREPNALVPGGLLVAPCFLPNVASGDYWVLAVGTDASGRYTWGVVSAGQPTVSYDDGCTTKETGTNGAGLWVFTRAAVPRPQDVSEARAALKGLGYTLQRLQPVVQQGCNYTGALIRPN